MKKVFSWDCETNGLIGKAFAIGAVLYDEEGNEVKKFYARCPIEGKVDPWVQENVLPQMEGMELTHDSYESMLQAFGEFFLSNKEDAHVIFHMGNPVEGRVICDLHDLGILGPFDGAYPWLDVAGCLLQAGYAPDSVDAYNKANGIEVPMPEPGVCSSHRPCWATVRRVRRG